MEIGYFELDQAREDLVCVLFRRHADPDVLFRFDVALQSWRDELFGVGGEVVEGIGDDGVGVGHRHAAGGEGALDDGVEVVVYVAVVLELHLTPKALLHVSG